MERVLQYAKTLIKQCTGPGSIAIDCTTGNGNDTLFLANLVTSSGKVYGFDIQEAAIQRTEDLLRRNQIEHVTLFNTSHEHLKECIPTEDHQRISSAMFNLGYLPKGDHHITTTQKTTLLAIKHLLEILKPQGIIAIVVYTGHEEGRLESIGLNEYLETLNQKEAQVLKYQFLNQKNDAPYLIAIEKLR